MFLPGESQGWGEPGGLPSMGLHKVEHDWSDLAADMMIWDDIILLAESEEELKSLLMRVKKESEKAGLKLKTKETKMTSSLIISWQIDGETMETVTDFIFLGYKITTDGDCSHEIKRHVVLGRKAMTNLDSILKSRDITLLTMSI